MIELIRDLAGFLAQDQLTVEEVVSKIGPVAHDPGIPMPIDLQPKLPGIRKAKLALYPNTGEPYLLTFEPSEGAEPSVGALKAFLGDFKRALTGRGVTPELVFPPAGDGRRWRIVVIATVEKASDLDLARVQSISFRRDPVEAKRATNLD